jgi:hypothetical protein
MFYTGINPLDMKPVHAVTDYHEKQLQRALLQYNRPENADLVREALTKAGRTDLIGFGPECLVRPAGAVHAPNGKPAFNGKPATNGKPGANGKPAANGKPGANGKPPFNGKPTGNGKPTTNGKPTPKGNKPTAKNGGRGGR